MELMNLSNGKIAKWQNGKKAFRFLKIVIRNFFVPL
jgi:hypothetical protein